MSAHETVTQLNDAGRFIEALKALNEVSGTSLSGSAREVLHAELLERVGRFSHARIVLQKLIKRNDLGSGERSCCELVLGKIEWEEGRTESAIEHLQRSVQLASDAGELRRRCWPNMLLLVSLSDRSGPDAVAPILSELRNDATKLGEPLILAALHSYTGQMEAKRGLFASALWHVQRSEQILKSAPNFWIEAQLEFTRTNIAVLSADHRSALKHGHHAIQLAEQSGSAACRRTALGNLGFVFYSLGKFAEAVQCLERAIAVLPSPGESHSAMIDTLARIRLAQGRHSDCRALLDRIESEMKLPNDRLLYAHRHAAFTRARLLASERQFQDALAQIDRTLSLADEAKDHFLLHRGQLTKAQFLQQAGREAESLALIDTPGFELVAQSPDLHAQYETIFACALAAAGQRNAADAHRLRAERLYSSLHHAPGLLELSRCWEVAIKDAPAAEPTASRATPSPSCVLQAVAALMVQASRPEYLAHELVSLLGQTDCVRRAVAMLIDATREPELLAATEAAGSPPYDADAWPRRLVVGRVRNRTAELWLEPAGDIESIATVNAVALLVSTVHELERGRGEREHRLTLWPIDDTPIEDGRAVVGGRMRELMTHAKRIAVTNVGVLLTGESGTGKEILARAVHNYSGRADKPFLPFNCAAIPREMLESQLFGHRRGAFTGADRDSPGVIRAARGGTLFLDEIGELSLDLQPKLLRFLESGEICPLGESTPFTVDVRVIAATNANLETAVKGGRFREDLFYRLNVVRLLVPALRERREEIPALAHHFLAAAAAEYRKGRIRIAQDTMEQLLLFPWPGNIRQLQNEIRRMVAFAEPGAVLTPAALSVEVANARPPAPDGQPRMMVRGEKLRPVLDRIECEMIKVALRDHNGHVDAAAKALGISRKGLYLKRQRLGL
jgi:DNA-binding NtrC family response regulator/tetratricopeptide (TPR) repeat protein